MSVPNHTADLLTILRAMCVAFRGIVEAIEIDPDTTNLTVSANGDPIAKVTVGDLLRQADDVIRKAEGR